MPRPQPGGPPPAVIVQRLAIRYAKRSRMRFASHRDVARAIERGVRKAGLPVAYSAGFSPHPRISYSGGAPTGAASEAEYLEIALTRRCDPAEAGLRLDAALPDGIDVIDVAEADAVSAMRLDASEWEVTWPGVTPAAAEAAVRAFLDAPVAEVERLTSRGTRRLDARAAVARLEAGAVPAVSGHGTGPAGACALLRMIVRHMTPAVRPDDVLAALGQASGITPSSPPLMTRLWQGPLDDVPPAARAERGRPQGPEQPTDKAQCLPAEGAAPAPAGQGRADHQLPRGAPGQLTGRRAREPYGRDCPDARNRATEQTVRIA